MIIVWLLLALLGCVLLVVGVLIATPMHLRLSAEAGERTLVRAEVRTLWGLSPLLKLEGGGAVSEPVVSERPTGRETRKRRKKKGTGMDGDKVLRLLQAVPEALFTALRHIHIDRLRLTAAFGLDDPADTGQAWGMLTPMIYGLACERAEIAVQPDFDGRRFEGSADVAVHLTPLAVAWPFLRLFLLFRRMRR